MRRGVRLPLEQLAPYLLTVADLPFVLDFRSIFGNARPVEIEVGVGKGLFLLTAAIARPDVNYLGIEIERKYQLFTANRVAKRGLSNVRLGCADARTFFHDYLRSDSVDAVHVYFPDPWWKKRHHKRRLWTPEFAGQCARVLRQGGELHVATDVAEYFNIINGLLSGQRPLQPLTPPTDKEPEHDLDYLTNFERKSRKAGKPIHRAVYQKV